MRRIFLSSHMSHHGAPAVEPMCSTGVSQSVCSDDLRSVAKSLHPPTVLQPHERSRRKVESAHAAEAP